MAQPDWHRLNSEWVRRWVFDHPDATVDEIARAANNARHGIPRGVVADVRREVHAILAKGITDKPPEAFNPPKLVTEVVPQQQVIAPAPAPAPKDGRVDPGTMEERRRFVDDYLLAHPEALSRDVIIALKQKFGVAVSSNYISEALYAVRDATGVMPAGGHRRHSRNPKAIELVVQGANTSRATDIDSAIVEAARALKAAMVTGRIRKLMLTIEDGADAGFSVDWSTELHMARKGTVKL